jgi:hypothetical protein
MGVLFENEDVQIVSPDTPGSIPIFTQVGYNDPLKTTDFGVCDLGLKSYNEIRRTNMPELANRKTGRWKINNNHNDYIFFRAPYIKHEVFPIEQLEEFRNHNDFESIFKLFYGKTRIEILDDPWLQTPTNLVTIHVNPEKTYVYSSSARVIHDGATEKEFQQKRLKLQNSRNLLIEYLKKPGYEYEVVVKIPFIPPEWFSSCLGKPDISAIGKQPRKMNNLNLNSILRNFKRYGPPALSSIPEDITFEEYKKIREKQRNNYHSWKTAYNQLPRINRTYMNNTRKGGKRKIRHRKTRRNNK